MRRLFLSALVALALSPCASADPYVGYAYPSVVQAGSTNRIVVGGQRLWSLTGGWVSGDGVAVVDIRRVPSFPVPNGKGQRAWLDKWLYAILHGRRAMPSLAKIPDGDLVGWTRCTWWETMDELGDLELSMIAHDLFTPRNRLQASPSLSERAILTVVAAPDARPGVRRLVLFDARGATAPRPFVVSDLPQAAEPLYRPPQRKGKSDPAPEPVVVSPPVVLNGQILPGETDVFLLSLKAEDRLVCQVLGRELTPYLGDAVPGFFNPVLCLKDESGRELAFADDYSYLPDPVLSCTVAKSGTYRLEVRDNLFRGRADFVYAVTCTTDGRPLPPVAERAFAVAETNAPAPVAEGSREGVLSEPGESAAFDFDVSAPGTWLFDLKARRNGSPLDGVLRLYGPLSGWLAKSGPLLATWDDVTNTTFVGRIPQAECDPIGSWTFAEPGRYRVTVDDRNGCGGPDYAFSLLIAPSEPSFEAYANKSAFVVQPDRSRRLAFKVRVVRHNGFAGPVSLDGCDLLKLSPKVVPATNDELRVTAEVLRHDWAGLREVRLSARAEVAAGRIASVPIVPADEMEQAFAYTHLLTAPCFRLYAAPRDTSRVAPPEWPVMPVDRILPPRVIRKLLDGRKEAAVIEIPTDADDGILSSLIATAGVRLRQRQGNVYAYESSDSAAARAVLAGVRRLVDRDLAFRDGTAERVRAFARASLQTLDNDVLVFVPSTDTDPLSGRVGELARKLRGDGWACDFVTEASLATAPLGRFRLIVVPCAESDVSAETLTRLKTAVKERSVRLVFNPANVREMRPLLSNRCRRDVLPEGLRFARFGQEWGVGWYFVFNPTSRRIEGTCRFGIRGRARSAFAMSVVTGKVSPLTATGDAKAPKFTLALEPGESAWVMATTKER